MDTSIFLKNILHANFIKQLFRELLFSCVLPTCDFWCEKMQAETSLPPKSNKKEYLENNEKSKQYFIDKNYNSAYESYKLTLNSMRCGFLNYDGKSPSDIGQFVGCSVLAKVEDLEYSNCTYHSGYIAIADSDTQTVDLILSNNLDGEDEMNDVNIKNIVLISPYTFSDDGKNENTGVENLGQLQCNLYLNLARCAIKLHLNSEAIMHCTIAISLANHIHKKLKAEKRQSIISIDTWIKGFYIRSKAHLNMLHFKQAKKDAKKIKILDSKNEDSMKLLNLIEKKEKHQMKKDKKMIKQICQHVQAAMDTNKKLRGVDSAHSLLPEESVSSGESNLLTKANQQLHHGDRTNKNENQNYIHPVMMIVSFIVLCLAGLIYMCLWYFLT